MAEIMRLGYVSLHSFFHFSIPWSTPSSQPDSATADSREASAADILAEKHVESSGSVHFVSWQSALEANNFAVAVCLLLPPFGPSPTSLSLYHATSLYHNQVIEVSSARYVLN